MQEGYEEPQDCLKVSTSVVEFQSNGDNIKNVTIKNIHMSMAIAYKIKTNNLEAIEAYPNYGFLKANTALSLRIKANMNEDFEAKLLIAYAPVG